MRRLELIQQRIDEAALDLFELDLQDAADMAWRGGTPADRRRLFTMYGTGMPSDVD